MTKHYFIGDKRIAFKLGTGKFHNVYGISSIYANYANNVAVGQKDYAVRMLEIEKLDQETGLYYGARYLNPVTSLWNGVVPLTVKYTSLKRSET